MFSSDEKKKIASEIEKLLLSLNHPEMPKEKPMFHLRVEGAESWSFADIKPNWTFNDNNKPGINLWNENSRKILVDRDKEKQEVVEEATEDQIVVISLSALKKKRIAFIATQKHCCTTST